MDNISEGTFSVKQHNIIRAQLTICGTRPLLQHHFGPDAIPLEKQERTGVAGNDPEEWKKTCMVTSEGQLYILGSYVFGCLRDAARHTKKGRGSIQPLVESTLQVEDEAILLDRFLPKVGDPPRDPTSPVYLDVRGVVNKSTGGRNVRYRLAASKGWRCVFTILWDKTIVARDLMKAVIREASILQGLGDGLRIGMGRFAVEKYEELDHAEEEASQGTLGQEATNSLEPRRKKVRPMQDAALADGVPH